jgi:hypothetical protein
MVHRQEGQSGFDQGRNQMIKKITPEISLRELMDSSVSVIRKIIEVDQEEVLNMVMAQTEDNQMHLCLCPWSSDKERRFIIDIMKKKFKEWNVCRYVNVCESWVSTNMALHEAGIQPRDDPQREEVIHIIGVDHREILGRAWYIINEGGKRRLGPERKMPSGVTIGGELTELMGEKVSLN